MTEEQDRSESIAAGITSRVTKKTVVLVGIAALGGIAYSFLTHSPAQPWVLPFGILFGGALGLLNFRWLAKAVERLYLRKGAHAAVSVTAAEFLHLVKLAAVFLILFIVIRWQLVHLFGMIAGLSLSFIAILWEGLTAMRTLKR
ncbi:MAG: ATP synthase subunit I [Nitrospiraceae bacterium]|nr:ATP synthase subunit I [Nitrospiraceae bacterium]